MFANGRFFWISISQWKKSNGCKYNNKYDEFKCLSRNPFLWIIQTRFPMCHEHICLILMLIVLCTIKMLYSLWLFFSSSRNSLHIFSYLCARHSRFYIPLLMKTKLLTNYKQNKYNRTFTNMLFSFEWLAAWFVLYLFEKQNLFVSFCLWIQLFGPLFFVYNVHSLPKFMDAVNLKTKFSFARKFDKQTIHKIVSYTDRQMPCKHVCINIKCELFHIYKILHIFGIFCFEIISFINLVGGRAFWKLISIAMRNEIEKRGKSEMLMTRSEWLLANIVAIGLKKNSVRWWWVGGQMGNV